MKSFKQLASVQPKPFAEIEVSKAAAPVVVPEENAAPPVQNPMP